MIDHKHQLLLQLNIPIIYDYGTWQRHDGVESACDRMALWSLHGGRIWLHSDEVAGKTHLLRSFSHDYPAAGLIEIVADDADGKENSWQLVQPWIEKLHGKSHWLIDLPAGLLPKVIAHALFHLLERARDLQKPIIVAWRGDLKLLPPELSSRLQAMEKLALSPPASDEDLLQVLRASASCLQWDIREQVLQAMLTYLPRHLDILLPALKELERLSLEQKHKPGAAWVKQQLTSMASALVGE